MIRMSISYKDVAEFALQGNPPTMVEVTVSPVGGQWEATARSQRATEAWEPLGRRFRAQAKGDALGKMVRWVRGKFPEAIPVSQRHVTAR